MRISQQAAAFAQPIIADRVGIAHRERPEARAIQADPSDRVTLSPEAKAITAKPATDAGRPAASADQPAASELSESEQAEVVELKARDAEVRRHESAHAAAAGSHANGGPTYDYERGPDGKQYAVGGHVGIDTAPVSGDPKATLAKAETIRRAALAPAEPSSQDQRVAAKATAMAAEARRELASQVPTERIVGNQSALASYASHA